MSRDHNDMIAVVAAVDVSNGKVGFEYCRLECHNRQYGTLIMHGTGGPRIAVEQSPEHKKLLAPYGKAIMAGIWSGSVTCQPATRIANGGIMLSRSFGKNSSSVGYPYSR
jgi:hypothetical protein